jgi:teichuronic acid biosynthesis glycosyltransferase TuaC
MYPTSDGPMTGTFVADQVESLRKAGVDIELLHLNRNATGRHVYRGLAERARHVVAAEEPDLVHVMYGGVMADIITRTVRDRPVLVSFCGSDLLGRTADRILDAISLRYGVLASRRAAARAAGIVVKSRNLLDALPRRVDAARVWIVPNGVDFSRFRPRDRVAAQNALGWDTRRAHLLFPAPRARPEKRFALAESAVGLLHRSGVNVELHPLEQVPRSEVPLWLSASSAILLTSAYEGSPNVVKEALASNVAVVSVDVGDVRERIEDIDGCFIADPTPADLADKLCRALEHRGPIDARAGLSELSLEHVAEKLRLIYGTLISASNAGDELAARPRRTRDSRA